MSVTLVATLVGLGFVGGFFAGFFLIGWFDRRDGPSSLTPRT